MKKRRWQRMWNKHQIYLGNDWKTPCPMDMAHCWNFTTKVHAEYLSIEKRRKRKREMTSLMNLKLFDISFIGISSRKLAFVLFSLLQSALVCTFYAFFVSLSLLLFLLLSLSVCSLFAFSKYVSSLFFRCCFLISETVVLFIIWNDVPKHIDSENPKNTKHNKLRDHFERCQRYRLLVWLPTLSTPQTQKHQNPIQYNRQIYGLRNFEENSISRSHSSSSLFINV